MLKKFRLLLILLLLLLCCLAGCSSGETTDDLFSWSNSIGGETNDPATTDPATVPDSGAVLMEDGVYDDPATSPDTSDRAEGGEYSLDYNGEQYLAIADNQEQRVSAAPQLTFSLKVDTASYSNVERYIESGNLPPADAVRVEELINYFSYDEPLEFSGDDPFAIYTEIGPSPFDADKYLAMIRVKTEEIAKEELPPSNLTFLIDTSGSMNSYDKLPLLQEAFTLLTETLDEDDTVSIVTYAGSAGVVLDSVSGESTMQILHAINTLEAGGSTAGAEGILTAYALAEKNFREGGNNRIILASDGDFNVGVSSLEGLEELVTEKRNQGIYLSILGFGTGNTRDDIMETLAKHGNGNYSYISSVNTARKVLVDELAANLYTVADDVKAQVEFNPANVESYRLIGYENRALANRDFADDTKDAGEIGVGTDVVVLLELTLPGNGGELKYAENTTPASGAGTYGDELFEVRIRYKHPGESASNLLTRPVTYSSMPSRNSSDFGFAGSVAAFGQMLRGSQYVSGLTIRQVQALAEDNLGRDEKGYRQGFLQLLARYRDLAE